MTDTSLRITQASVNCIIRCGEEFLFMERSKDKDIDAGVVNVLGGKVKDDENYAQAALREAREETGDIDGVYITNRMEYIGTFIFRGGYKKDWIAQFYIFEVEHKNLPGNKSFEEGNIFWQHKDSFEQIENPIWDLPLIWPEIVNDNVTFQAIAQLDETENVISFTKTVLDERGELLKTEQYLWDNEQGNLSLQV